jgi:hypothetical protein
MPLHGRTLANPGGLCGRGGGETQQRVRSVFRDSDIWTAKLHVEMTALRGNGRSGAKFVEGCLCGDLATG